MDLLRLFGWNTTSVLARGRGWTIEVVGEASYQGNLQQQYRSHGGVDHDVKALATLMPEDGNKHDPNAVKVEIGRQPVGYLTREMSAQYRAALGASPGQCEAKIAGGFVLEDGTNAHFGVKLNMAWPPRFAK
jgi:hypothetical protein